MTIDTFLINFFSFIIIGFSGAFMTLFFNWIIGSPHDGYVEKGRILSWYGHWLKLKYELTESEEDDRVDAISQLLQKTQKIEPWIADELAEKRRRLNYYKILGACPYCTCPYITLIIFIFCFFVIGQKWWLIFPVLGLAHYVLNVSMYLEEYFREKTEKLRKGNE